MIKLAILLIICCKVSTFYIEKLNLKFFCYSNNLNRNIDAALKLRRLKQLKSEGKRYTDYLNEKSRLDNVNSSNVSKAEILQKIVEYKDEKSDKCRNKIRKMDIVLLPDVGVKPSSKEFYKDLFDQFNISLLGMPDVHSFNTKRYEFQWMSYMRQNLRLDERDLVIAHGSSADAMLRYIESDTVKKLLLIDGSHIYTAGERHGREYRYELIKNNVEHIALLSSNTLFDIDLNVLIKDMKIPNKLYQTSNLNDEKNDIININITKKIYLLINELFKNDIEYLL